MIVVWALVVAVAVLGGVILISYIVEALRRAPRAPKTLRWGPAIPVDYIDAVDYRLRYIKAGAGPNLVLLHTLRTQLDLFEKVVPALTRRFTVYALDYPGHGYSDIPNTIYDAEFFVRAVERFLEALELQDVTLCGVSIGGSIGLIIAGRRNRRVTRVMAINPYDYARGRGMARSSRLGWMITVTSEIPIIGGMVMRLRNFMIMKAVLRGGVANPDSIPPALLREMYMVGNRRNHYRAFLSLLSHAASWEAATEVYRHITVPVRLIWGDRDWARPAERERERTLVSGAQVTTIPDGGHFLPLDRPQELQDLILSFAGT